MAIEQSYKQLIVMWKNTTTRLGQLKHSIALISYQKINIIDHQLLKVEIFYTMVGHPPIFRQA